MCHSTCSTCTSGSSEYSSCLTCITSRYLFQSTCLCHKGMNENSDFTCSTMDDMWSILLSVTFFMNIFLIVLLFSSLVAKKNLPLTRKVIDVCQVIGLIMYFDEYYNPKTQIALELHSMTNFSTTTYNQFGILLYGKDMDSIQSDSYKFIQMQSEGQNPSLKFLMNGKTQNFFINQTEIMIIWVIGYLIFAVTGIIINFFEKKKGFSDFIKDNFINYVSIIFYFTFQDSCLNLYLQFMNLKWDIAINYASLIALGVYLVICILVLKFFIVCKNFFPNSESEMEELQKERQMNYHFLFIYDFFPGYYPTQPARFKVIERNWILISILQKAILTALIVFARYDFLKYLIISVVGLFLLIFLLNFTVENIKRYLLHIFADGFTIFVIFYNSFDYYFYALLGGVFFFFGIFILEQILNNSCYQQDTIQNKKKSSRKVEQGNVIPQQRYQLYKQEEERNDVLQIKDLSGDPTQNETFNNHAQKNNKLDQQTDKIMQPSKPTQRIQFDQTAEKSIEPNNNNLISSNTNQNNEKIPRPNKNIQTQTSLNKVYPEDKKLNKYENNSSQKVYHQKDQSCQVDLQQFKNTQHDDSYLENDRTTIVLNNQRDQSFFNERDQLRIQSLEDQISDTGSPRAKKRTLQRPYYSREQEQEFRENKNRERTQSDWNQNKRFHSQNNKDFLKNANSFYQQKVSPRIMPVERFQKKNEDRTFVLTRETIRERIKQQDQLKMSQSQINQELSDLWQFQDRYDS